MRGFFYALIFQNHRFETLKYYLLDRQENWENLLPLTFTRSIGELRLGLWTNKERWEKYLGESVGIVSQDYLQRDTPPTEPKIFIDASILPSSNLVEAIKSLKEGEQLHQDVLARFGKLESESSKTIDFNEDCLKILHPYDLFRLNGEVTRSDIKFLKDNEGLKSAAQKFRDAGNQIIGDELYAEDGVTITAAILNTELGPVYLAKGSQIMEGSTIRGPFVLGEGSTVKMQSKIYGATTIGPHSKVGGEINNSVVTGYSNKAHDGFLGNSVLGEFCNLGADTNNSNLKNNYAEVKLWSYPKESFRKTGLQFCGLVMGDHSKCGINTMFNTGTVVGVSSNIFGSGFPRNFVPSFSWGGSHGFKEYRLDKSLEVAEIVMARREIALDAKAKKILEEVFNRTSKFRENY